MKTNILTLKENHILQIPANKNVQSVQRRLHGTVILSQNAQEPAPSGARVSTQTSKAKSKFPITAQKNAQSAQKRNLGIANQSQTVQVQAHSGAKVNLKILLQEKPR